MTHVSYTKHIYLTQVYVLGEIKTCVPFAIISWGLDSNYLTFLYSSFITISDQMAVIQLCQVLLDEVF